MSKSIKILHLETSTEVCSVAVSENGVLLAERNTTKGFVHSSQGTLLVDECLEETGLRIKEMDAISVSEGPGSYTGLRVGFSMAKGFCYALDIPFIVIPTLEALAHGLAEQQPDTVISPMIDARRMEVYTASYKANLESVAALQALILDEHTYMDVFGGNVRNVFIGDGAHKVAPWLRVGQDQIVDKICSARDQAELALNKYQNKTYCDIAYTVPLYLKSPNITVSKKNMLT